LSKIGKNNEELVEIWTNSNERDKQIKIRANELEKVRIEAWADHFGFRFVSDFIRAAVSAFVSTKTNGIDHQRHGEGTNGYTTKEETHSDLTFLKGLFTSGKVKVYRNKLTDEEMERIESL